MRSHAHHLVGVLAITIGLATLSTACGTSRHPEGAGAPELAWAEGSGGWASSGGELLKDSQNPWWVRNTHSVRYCLSFDREGFSADPIHASRIARQALAYWQNEFRRGMPFLENAEPTNELFRTLGVGYQEFIEVTCDGREDLRFQFGAATLTPEQRRRIPTPRNYLGIAARTDYDEVNLKGRGFVFIASDRGPERYDGGAALVDNAWSKDLYLSVILLHELGHVFGIPHVGDEMSLMSQQLPELLLSKALEQGLGQLPPQMYPSFFFPPPSFRGCRAFPQLPLEPQVRAFFGLGERVRCVNFDSDPASPSQLVVTASDTADWTARREPVGRIEGMNFVITEAPIAMMLRLNPRQTVFEVPGDPSAVPFLIGPFQARVSGTGGRFVPRTGESQAVFLDLAPTHFTVYVAGTTGIVALLAGP